MENGEISLKPVKELFGMNFIIPDYQRGYRWEKQQAIDLLEDIYAFANDSQSGEIYCIQPLVVSKKDDDDEILEKCKSPETTLEDIKKYIKGSWNVVDGQQRLTTIYLILSCLEIDDTYEIAYDTREGSKAFLKNIRSENAETALSNIDHYHMYLVYTVITEWLDSKEEQDPAVREKLRDVLCGRVDFIWYQVTRAEEIAVFTRLNIGKIPLTDSELIKALFLNRANFDTASSVSEKQAETKRHKIALEWDRIEYALQNDEFWAFLHDVGHDSPTRIDIILDSICKKDRYSLYGESENNETKKSKIEAEQKARRERIGNDEHMTFRYFNEAFGAKRDKHSFGWLDEFWDMVRKYYQIFNEWYHDYRLYHYIGYLTSIRGGKTDITEYVLKWEKLTKDGFIEYIRSEIAAELRKKEWISNIYEQRFDSEYNGKPVQKKETAAILLLHNIETIVQQNEKLAAESKYELPNFSKFPFHLFKRENWQVEHIRPAAGDDFKKKGMDKLYLALAKRYFDDDEILTRKIDDYINGDENEAAFEELLTDITQKGGFMSDEDKDRLWNFVLLDESTNKEYGNQIFPVKRAFIANKEKGIKINYSFSDGELKTDRAEREIAFVPPCTKNVFSKFYTEMPSTMLNWTIEDAEAYQRDISQKLKYYFDIIGVGEKGV